MDLKGKTVAFLGDSITYGGRASAPDRRYTSVFERISGAHVYKSGGCGTRIAPQRVQSANPTHDWYFASRISELPPTADVVCVFGGTNDFGHGDAPLGTPDDATEETFCGAFRVLIKKLRAAYPTARITAVTPLPRAEEERLAPDGVTVKHLVNYVDAMLAVAKADGVEIADAYRDFGMPAVNCAVQYYHDGLHPNDLGHKTFAEKLYAWFKNLK